MTKGHTAVRASKRPRISDREPWQKLELFPTPPFATRALFAHVLPALGILRCTGPMWEPCAGLGHMSSVMAEQSNLVVATDVHHYGAPAFDADIWNTVDATNAQDVEYFCAEQPRPFDWIITNPPFTGAATMLPHFLKHAQRGVAFLQRLQWLESSERYELFQTTPPTLVAQFAERVAMCEGGWDPKCSTATAYAWFIWLKDRNGELQMPSAAEIVPGAFDFLLIPPGCKKRLTRPHDAKLATRHVPGWVPPSTLKKLGKQQLNLLQFVE